jgi:hypothetical protein
MIEAPQVELGSSHGTFQPGDFVRENRALQVLRDAHVTAVPHPIELADEAAPTPGRSAGGI